MVDGNPTWFVSTVLIVLDFNFEIVKNNGDHGRNARNYIEITKFEFEFLKKKNPSPIISLILLCIVFYIQNNKI